MAEDDKPRITSITDVDSLVSNTSDSTLSDRVAYLNPFERRFWDSSLPHRHLLHIKDLYRTHPAVDRQFKQRRDLHLDALQSQTPSIVHLRAFEKAFSEINRAYGGCFGGGQIKRFLDLGCSPGGFSTWLMKSNGGAHGVGITLPEEDAGFPLSIDPTLCASAGYQVQYRDIIQMVRESVTVDGNPTILPRDDSPNSDEPTAFDLVVAGAFRTLQGHTRWWYRMQLSFSQLLIVLSNTAQGGSCVFALSTKPFLWIVDTIGVMRQCFESVTAHKGGKLHAVRTFRYLVCRGFHASAEELALITGRIRVAMKFLEDVAESDAQRWSPEDVPLLSGQSASEIFEAQHQFVLELLEPLWEAQFQAIRASFANILASENGGEHSQLMT
ncbi:hypothetical protein WOLCODRAFT_92246 [Wolfiporia cocos MD-104 SS10]|uniref:Ribosomal RNA methyltransferase FtsJ domain-containing protein n=1 Tax=Wolfiporia cocos (strain MD-104) TaxID=742152 RepID=A0A2H3JK58_WOLCO|nr:hypothetical protein WOLCODRAFT_92246 [Wolfiporia cocos MD-104 SS10]